MYSYVYARFLIVLNVTDCEPYFATCHLLTAAIRHRVLAGAAAQKEKCSDKLAS